MTTDTPSDNLVKRLEAHAARAEAFFCDIPILSEAADEITRLRAELAEMEDCKNTCATLAYEREQEVFKLRAELAEAKQKIYLAKRLEEARAQQPDWEKLWAEVSERAEQAERDLVEARAQRDESDAVIVMLVEVLTFGPLDYAAKYGPDVLPSDLEQTARWRAEEAISRHRAKEEEKNRG